MRAAVDVMGGDKAPVEILKGCWEAASLLGGDDAILLVGDQAICEAGLAESGLTPDQKKFYRIVPSTQVIGMDESPVEAVRAKPDSSINVMNKLAAKGEADVVISAGNTGACGAASQLRMRLLPGLKRPGIAVAIPTAAGPVVLCDAGSTVDSKPFHILQYAFMAAAYASAILKKPTPRVGLLSIGEEDAKGNAVTKDAHQLLRADKSLNFIGNVEGKDLVRGVADVIVCDGFVGNVVLKLMEGVTESLFRQVQGELIASAAEAMPLVKPALKKVASFYDWQEFGGAPLLGVNGYSIICHGRSEARAIKNAIKVGQQMVVSGLNARIVEQIEQSDAVAED